MPMFNYKAMSAQGILKVGSESADTQAELIARLRQRQYLPVSVEEAAVGKDINTLPFLGKVKVKQLSVFSRQFATMLSSGVTIVSCLDILRQQTTHKRLREVTDQLYEDVQKGLTFSESLKKHRSIFPELMVQMVEAGEASGSLDLVMARIAVHFEKENRINSRVKSAMVYPIVLSVVCVIVVVFLLTNVMPTFIGMFEGSDVPLPAPTLMLLTLSNAMRNFWYLFLAAVAVIAIAFQRYANTPAGRLAIDRIKLRIPVVRDLVQKTASARFARTMSTLLSSGLPLLQVMENTAGSVGNKAIEEAILAAREDVRKGAALSVPIRRMKIFPPMVHSMIEIGEESGSLDELLEKTANIYDEEVDLEVGRLLALMEPLLIVFMAVIIGFIVISMMLPMFGMLKTI